MPKKIFLPLLIILSIFLLIRISVFPRVFFYPYHPLKITSMTPYVIQDLSIIMAGVRRLGADLAWIQLLQYYGSPEKQLDKETEFRLSIKTLKFFAGLDTGDHHHHHAKHDNENKSNDEDIDYHPQYEGGTYSEFLSYCYRVVELDPFFQYAYLYGAGALAWNLDRPEEALELLDKGRSSIENYGIRTSNDVRYYYWRINLYMSAIIYRKSDEVGKMVPLLEIAVKQPDCPNLMKVILANLYEKNKEYTKSLIIWITVFESGDISYRKKAEEKILKMKKF